MATEKITISEQLRNHIIERRKEYEYTAAELSEKSGHSKYWLSNIESGKTKKISKKDLVSIYKVLLEYDNEDEILAYLEKIINQPISNKNEHWYNLISIENQYEELMDLSDLNNELNKLLIDIQNRIKKEFNDSYVHGQQAILTSLLHLQRSLIANPELAFTLLYVPVYCTLSVHPDEYKMVLGQLLLLASKFDDLLIKNDDILPCIEELLNEEKEQLKRDKNTANSALTNFKTILGLINSFKSVLDPQLDNVLNLYYLSVIDFINKIKSGIISINFPAQSQIQTGKDFKELIEMSFQWFQEYQTTLSLPDIPKYIPHKLYRSATNMLEHINEIKCTPI